MDFARGLHVINTTIDKINRWLGRSLAWLAVAMALLIGALVFMRTFFNIGSIAAQEAVTYMHAFMLMLTMGYTLQQDGHIRVDIFYRKLSDVGRAWINGIGSILLLLPFSIFLILVSWPGTLTSWKILEGSSNTGGIPATFLLKSLLPLTGLLLGLQAVTLMCRSLLVITFSSNDQDSAQKDHNRG